MILDEKLAVIDLDTGYVYGILELAGVQIQTANILCKTKLHIVNLPKLFICLLFFHRRLNLHFLICLRIRLRIGTVTDHRSS